MSKSTQPERALLTFQPTERLFAAQEYTYKEALIPTHPHFTVRSLAKQFAKVNALHYPNFAQEIIDTQQQLQKLLPQLPVDKGLPDEDSDLQIVSLLRKGADEDMGRQYMLEQVVAPLCGIPDGSTLPERITPEMLAYVNAVRERIQKGVYRRRGSLPFIDLAIIEINALESTLALGKQTFIDRFRYFHRANRALAMILLGPGETTSVDENIYAHLKGAVTGRLVKQIVEKHAPPQTTSYPPLIEMDMDWTTDGVMIHRPTDSVVVTTQTKSSGATVLPGTLFATKSDPSVDWTPHVDSFSYRNQHHGNIYPSPILLKNPASQAPTLTLHTIPVYNASFSPLGAWENSFHISIQNLQPRFLSVKRSVENAWKLCNGAIPYVVCHPNGITTIFGVVTYGQMETVFKQQQLPYPEKMRYLIDSCYENVK